ncbi:hypothetical protein [Kribbella caucasensis]|nr:hypothetical protein [Kribbella sp. VKM Ac-2527]
MHTTMRVSVPTRDELARVAEDEFGGISLDEALRIVLFEHASAAAIARLSADPEALSEYRAEAEGLEGVDTEIAEW